MPIISQLIKIALSDSVSPTDSRTNAVTVRESRTPSDKRAGNCPATRTGRSGVIFCVDHPTRKFPILPSLFFSLLLTVQLLRNNKNREEIKIEIVVFIFYKLIILFL